MDTEKYKTALLKEKDDLEKDLKSISVKNTENPGDFDPKFPNMNAMSADKSEMADEVEEFDNIIGIEARLEERLRDVNDALKKIEERTFGKCEKDGEMIDEKRLEANPAARTCMEHAK